jgi:UDP-N-acetyl-D-mannosaminuronic acid transferase (WecB/TagA/CpsF family)
MRITPSQQDGLHWNKLDLFGVDYSAIDYSTAVSIIQRNAIERRSYGVSTLAVHGLTTAVSNHYFLRKLRDVDLIVPDGQPVRWMLNYWSDPLAPDREIT